MDRRTESKVTLLKHGANPIPKMADQTQDLLRIPGLPQKSQQSLEH